MEPFCGVTAKSTANKMGDFAVPDDTCLVNTTAPIIRKSHEDLEEGLAFFFLEEADVGL